METRHINEELEIDIISRIILDNNVYNKIQGLVRKEHFGTIELSKLYEFFEKRIIDGDINLTILKTFIFEEFGEVKGKEVAKILSLGMAEVHIFNDIVSLAKELIELYQKREFDAFILKLNSGGYQSFDDIKNNVLMKLYDLEVGDSSDPVSIQAGINLALNGEISPPLNTGYPKLDYLCGSFECGNLVILGGKPSSGKTSFALCMAMQMAYKYSVCFFSVEVKALAIYRKFINNVANIEHYKIKTKNFTDDEVEHLNNVLGDEFKNKRQLLVDDTKKLTINLLRSKIKKILLRNKLDIIFIDYLQLLTPEGKDFSREQQIAKIAIGLKQIATEFNIVVVALSQLSRNSDTRENKKPMLSDLRDSGSIEASADIVLFVHRDHYYMLQNKPPEHNQAKFQEWQQMARKVEFEADIIIAKNRDGVCGDVKFFFDKQYSRFEEVK